MQHCQERERESMHKTVAEAAERQTVCIWRHACAVRREVLTWQAMVPGE